MSVLSIMVDVNISATIPEVPTDANAIWDTTWTLMGNLVY